MNAVYKIIREAPFPSCRFGRKSLPNIIPFNLFDLLSETADNFRYAAGEHEHTAGYDATCTAICMTKMMAYIAEQTQFKENPMEHQMIKAFTGKSVVEDEIR